MTPRPQALSSDPAIRFMLTAKRLRVRDLEQLVTVGGLVGAISNLIHALQRERGISNVYLGSQGRQFADRLAQIIPESQAGAQAVRALFDDLEAQAATTAFAPRLFARIAWVLDQLAALTRMRAEIAAQTISGEDATTFFVEIIAGLLSVVFEASDTTADPAISRALVAMFNFMQGKEFAGQERATAAAGFSAGCFSEIQHARLLRLIDAQARSFQIFSQFAAPPLADQLATAMVGPGSADFERMRRVACVGGLRGQLAGIASRSWYDLATQRLDALYGVEQRVDGEIQALCLAKLAEARADLDDQCAHLGELDLPPTPAAFVIGEVDPSLMADAAKTGFEIYSVDGVSPKLGRSLLDLVQTQFRHLQQMSDELETARLAINERKIVERAKGVLMTHRNLTEQQAYELLRKTAMSQNRRMKEVAEAVISMAEILSP